jgi:hypothetical protein
MTLLHIEININKSKITDFMPIIFDQESFSHKIVDFL